MPLADGHWLSIEGHELQGWSGESAWALIADYILRVYVVRIIGVIGMCWLAVRLCLRPLKRLSDAANALGDNLDQKPLAAKVRRRLGRYMRTSKRTSMLRLPASARRLALQSACAIDQGSQATPRPLCTFRPALFELRRALVS